MPPLTEADKAPLLLPQVGLVGFNVTFRFEGDETVIVIFCAQEAASVTVTV